MRKQQKQNLALFQKLYSKLNIVNFYDSKKRKNPLLIPKQSDLVSKSITNKISMHKKLRYDKNRRIKTLESNHLFTNDGIINKKQNSILISKKCQQIFTMKDKLFIQKDTLLLNTQNRKERNRTLINISTTGREQKKLNIQSSFRSCSSHQCQKRRASRLRKQKLKNEMKIKQFDNQKNFGNLLGWQIPAQEIDISFN